MFSITPVHSLSAVDSIASKLCVCVFLISNSIDGGGYIECRPDAYDSSCEL
jgi:hypothetical protein